MLARFWLHTYLASVVAWRSPRETTAFSPRSHNPPRNHEMEERIKQSVRTAHWWSTQGSQTCGHQVRIRGAKSHPHVIGGATSRQHHHPSGIRDDLHRGTTDEAIRETGIVTLIVPDDPVRLGRIRPFRNYPGEGDCDVMTRYMSLSKLKWLDSDTIRSHPLNRSASSSSGLRILSSTTNNRKNSGASAP